MSNRTTVQLISEDGEIGTLTYRTNLKGKVHYDLQTTSKSVRRKIVGFIKKQRVFRIPESDKIDSYRTDKAIPTDNLSYFELALCELKSVTGIEVKWSDSIK